MCCLHVSLSTVPFDVDALVESCTWPSYLPNPKLEPWRYTPHELLVLAVLSRHPGEWMHLNYVIIDGNGQVVNNTIRKLRRKGFTIKGRRSGGYLLADRIPRLE